MKVYIKISKKLISCLFITVSILLCIMPHVAHTARKPQLKWLTVDEWTPCSSTCGKGRQIQRQICAQSLLYLPTLFYKDVNDSSCLSAGKARPKRKERECNNGPCPTAKMSTFVWTTGEWSECSKKCGQGIQNRPVECSLVTSANKKKASVNETTVTAASVEDEDSTKNGDVSGRSASAADKREDDALTSSNSTDLIASTYDKNCQSNKQPAEVQRCGQLDCAPEFVITKWGKCSQMRDCRAPGGRQREVPCAYQNRRGRLLPIPNKSMCYYQMSQKGVFKIPRSHEQCLEDPVYVRKCLSKKHGKNELDPAEFNLDSTSVYQTLDKKNIKLQIGQNAHVFLRSKLIIRCPIVKNLDNSVYWTQKENPKRRRYRYVGKVRRRIRVTRSNVLIIRNFNWRDEGIWICAANKANASITLNVHSRMDGYRMYLSRRMPEIPSEDSGQPKWIRNNDDQISWFKGHWQSCSVTCGKSGGVQRREVNCEQQLFRMVKVFPDVKCSAHLKQDVPKRSKSCHGLLNCPFWEFIKVSTASSSETTSKNITVSTNNTKASADNTTMANLTDTSDDGEGGSGSMNSVNETCSNECVQLHKAKLITSAYKLTCKDITGQIYPDKICESQPRPFKLCNNPACIPEWSYSKWSQCSKSCGDTGFQYRTRRCVWKAIAQSSGGAAGGAPSGSSLRTAGGICSELQFKILPTRRTCFRGSCRLKCLDLSKFCGIKQLCRYSHYRFMCCATCARRHSGDHDHRR